MARRPPVTLVIPTVYHRASFYARALRHLGKCGFRGPIVVTDHSPPELTGIIADITREQRGLQIELLWHEPEMHFLQRLVHCAVAAQTPYVHLHADDDFLVLATLDKLVEHMNRDAACSAAMGANVHVSFAGGHIHPLDKTGVLQAGAFDRLVAQMERYSSVLYALRRREELIATFSFTVPRCPDVQFWQYLESCVAAIRGTIAVLDDLHYVREDHAHKWTATLLSERSPDHFPYLVLSHEFQMRVTAFRGALLDACASGGVDADLARLDAALLHLLSRGLRLMLPEQTTAFAAASPQAVWAALQARLGNPQDPAAMELQRIFNSART